MKNFKFSILMSVNDQNSLESSFSSLLNQKLDFEDNVEVIVLIKEDEEYPEIKKYHEKYPENIVVVKNFDDDYNVALSKANGEYITFFDSHDKLTDTTLNEVVNAFSRFKDVNLVTIPKYILETNGNDSLNYRFEKNQLVDLSKQPEYIHISLKASFIKREIITKYAFNNDICLRDSFLLNQILIDNPSYVVINNCKYLFMKTANEEHDKKYLQNFIEGYCSSTIDYALEKYSSVPEFIQHILVFLISEIALVENTSEFFNESESEEFKSSLRNVLGYIGYDAIESSPKIPGMVKKFLIYFKNNDFYITKEKTEETGNANSILLRSKDKIIDNVNLHYLTLDFAQLKHSNMNFSGVFLSSCDIEFLKIKIKINSSGGKEEVFPVRYVEYPTTNRVTKRFLDVDWYYFYNFDFSYPVNLDENYEFTFIVEYGEDDKKLTFKPQVSFGTNSTVSVFSHYYVKGNKIVVFRHNQIQIIDYSTLTMFKFELRSIFKILTSSTKLQFYYSIFIRVLYFMYWPFLRNKRIWLFSDRPNSADDNAKHLFKYAVQQDDGIEKYFVVQKDVPDFNEMKKISKNIIGFKTLKNQIYYLFAEKVITTHVIDKFAHPLSHRNKMLYSGLNTSDKYFLQHGVTLGDISSRINKFMRNLSLFVNVSEVERKSIVDNPHYNYDEEIIQILGFPRYDNLKNDNVKKQILLMPTWRSYIHGVDSLLASEFFKVMNNMFTNERLISFLKENDFKLIFRPHPELIQYLHLFDIDNETVIVSKDESYQELFNGSSILVTDYSSVAFDFAYLKKPVLYYQYADEYNYDDGYFKFDSMGFGDVIEQEDDLIDEIIEIINNDCQMDEKYIGRVESFFKYTDRNNCKRVYDWIYND